MVTTIQMQNAVASAPTKSPDKLPKEAINETYNLLRDFGIYIKKSDIPCNMTIFDLHLWRRAKIKAYLQD